MGEPIPKKRKEAGKGREEQSEKYFAAEGVELVSSDGVRFRLPAFQLQAHSTVFRDRIDLAPTSPIELHDKELETATTLTALLDILLNDAVLSIDDVQDSQLVIRLAREYGFKSCLGKIRLQARSNLLDKACQSHWMWFVLAAMLRDPATCADAIRAVGIRADEDDEENEEEDEDEDVEEKTEVFGKIAGAGEFFETDTWPLHDVCLVGPDYMWAFNRAMRVVQVQRGKSLGRRDATKVAEEFSRLMGLEGAPKSDWAT